MTRMTGDELNDLVANDHWSRLFRMFLAYLVLVVLSRRSHVLRLWASSRSRIIIQQSYPSYYSYKYNNSCGEETTRPIDQTYILLVPGTYSSSLRASRSRSARV